MEVGKNEEYTKNRLKLRRQIVATVYEIEEITPEQSNAVKRREIGELAVGRNEEFNYTNKFC